MSERGTVLPALVMLLAGAAIVTAITVQVGIYSTRWGEASAAAEAGAETGAGHIDLAAAHRGELVIDVGRAEEAATRAALQARPRPGRVVEVTAGPSLVCVTVKDLVGTPLLTAIGAGGAAVEASACASPAAG